MSTTTKATMPTLAEAVSQFRAAIKPRRLNPESIIADGVLHRCDVEDKKPGNKAGAYVLHLDGVPAGGFQNLTDGLGWENWHVQIDRNIKLSEAERQAFAKQCAEAKAKRERERKAASDAAADEAAKRYAAAVEVDPAHGYLRRKGITAPPSVRQSGELLLIPMHDAITGKLRGLQTIAADGSKRFTTGMGLSGCAFNIGEPSSIVAIVEGMATGASVYAATGWPVVCSFTAGNLGNVAQAIRQQYPQARTVICGDNDHGTERAGKGNPGLKAGREAAKAVRGLLVAPPAIGGTDFNDLHLAHGLDALRTALTQAAGGDA